MQSAGSGRKKQNKSIWTPWLTAAFLAVLIIATAAVLAASLFSFVHRGEHVISLYDGLLTSSQDTGTSGSGSVKTTTGKTSGTEAQKSGLKVTDSQKVWTTDTTVELFKVSYTNKNGEITVRSSDNDKVIAPGTDGKYTFSLKNTGDSTADYKVWMEAKISSTSSTKLPIEARVSGNSGWLLGDDSSWKELSSLNEVSAKEKIDAGKTSQYTIYWQWPFEREEDVADTALGDTTVDQEISCTVIIHTLASGTGTADSDNGNDDNSSGNKAGADGSTASSHTEGTSRKAAKTADETDIMSWILLLCMAGGTAVILFLYRRKKEENQQEHEIITKLDRKE